MSTWLDLKENPRLKNVYETRAHIIRAVREFFWSAGFWETDTPIAVRYASQEPYLNFFPVTVHEPNNTMHRMYLRTSPEFALKKLLATGFDKIFEIGKCFRDFESFGGTHNPEFTMIEWYRSPGTLEDIMNDTENLFKYVGEKLKINELRLKDRKIKIDEPWERTTMKEVWKKYAGVDLDEYLEIEKLRNLVNERGWKANENDAYEDLFFKIFLNEIEQHLGTERPVFVYDYPAQMCSLSRPSKNEGYAERFELYIGGMEMANAFGELTDAKQQKAQLEKDRELRQQLSKETWPVDQEFIDALAALPKEDSGEMAKVGGIALGVDRMVVLFTGARDINEVLFQSMADQLN